MTAWLGFYVAVLTIRVEYWAGIKYEKKLNLFFFLIGIGVVIYIVAAVLHFYVYFYYFELFALPPPYIGLIPNTITAWVLIPILIFRYLQT